MTVDGSGSEVYYLMFLLMFVCERIIEKFGIRNMRESTALKHWDLLIFLPIITVAVLFIMLSVDIGNRYVGVTVSIGMILLNLIVFYICDELVGAYTVWRRARWLSGSLRATRTSWMSS